MRLFTVILLVLLASLATLGHAADLQPLMCERGELILSEDFSSGSLGKDWQVAKGKFEIVDGALKGAELPADDHAGVLAHAIKTRNLIVQFAVKFEGGKSTAMSLNSAQGHVCRATINPAGITVNKDSRDKNKTDKAAQLGTQRVAIQPGQWHTVLVEIRGPEIVAQLDGPQHATCGSHEGLDVDKTSLRFPVSGDAVFFKDLRVWEAGQPKATWDATKKKLESQRPTTPAKKPAAKRGAAKTGAAP